MSISIADTYSHRMLIKFTLESNKRLDLIEPRFFANREIKTIVKTLKEITADDGVIPSKERLLLSINQMKIADKEVVISMAESIYDFDLDAIDRNYINDEFKAFVKNRRTITTLEDLIDQANMLDGVEDQEKLDAVYKALSRAGDLVSSAAEFDIDAKQSYGFSLEDYEKIDAIDKDMLSLIQMDIDENGNQFNAFNRHSCSMMIGNPGVGKTQITDALMAQIINRDAPKLFWKLDKNMKSVLKIDTENGNSKVKAGIDKIAARAGVDGRDVVNHDDITYISTGALKLKRINKTVLDLIESQNQIRINSGKDPYDFIIIDDASGALNDRDINDIKAAGQLMNELISISEKYNCAVLITIHPNINDSKGRGRGHLGSEAQRWCDRVWQMVSLPNTPVSYMYMKGNENFKVRDGVGVSEIRDHAMVYDKDLNYFVELTVSEFEHWKVLSKERSEEKKVDHIAKAEMENEIINDTIINYMDSEGEDQVEFKDIVSVVKNILRISDRTCERKIQEFVSANKSRFSINKSGRSNVIKRSYPKKNVDLLAGNNPDVFDLIKQHNTQNK